jgi:hypothetical protein
MCGKQINVTPILFVFVMFLSVITFGLFYLYCIRKEPSYVVTNELTEEEKKHNEIYFKQQKLLKYYLKTLQINIGNLLKTKLKLLIEIRNKIEKRKKILKKYIKIHNSMLVGVPENIKRVADKLFMKNDSLQPRFYVYAYFKNNKVVYIGKGTNGRINDERDFEYDLSIKIKENLYEAEALALEKQLIDYCIKQGLKIENKVSGHKICLKSDILENSWD